MKDHNTQHIGGISAKLFVFPLWIIMAVLLSCIILLIIDVNRSSNDLFDLMERSGLYRLDVTNMQASNTIMSETGRTYILSPLDKNGSVNVGPLLTYANEVDSNRRAPRILERFKTYEVSGEVLSYVERAAELSEEMLDINRHAISLMASIYPLPPIPELSKIELIPLTPAEEAMSPQERETYARRLITEKEYLQLKFYINDNIDNCNNTLQNEFSAASAQTKAHVAKVRVLIWITIIAIILVFGLAFLFFYNIIIKPLIFYSKDISADRHITVKNAIFEMRQLAESFNGLLYNRNKLESVLRAAAENDALTGLPNRYSMRRDMINSGNFSGSVAVLLFDVNFLKKVNDTEGHLAGDTLLRNCASCIKECFGTENANNCYRIGGDEFVAILTDCGENDVKARIDRFAEMTADKKLTVSVGYSYTADSHSVSFENLMESADKNMYEHKRQIHEVYNTSKSDNS